MRIDFVLKEVEKRNLNGEIMKCFNSTLLFIDSIIALDVRIIPLVVVNPMRKSIKEKKFIDIFVKLENNEIKIFYNFDSLMSEKYSYVLNNKNSHDYNELLNSINDRITIGDTNFLFETIREGYFITYRNKPHYENLLKRNGIIDEKLLFEI